MKQTNAASYQSILRAIGQGIEKLGVESFDLENSEQRDFVVAGTFRDQQTKPGIKPTAKTSFLSLIVNGAKIDGERQTQSPLYQFSGVRFSHDKIDLLDRSGKASRWSHDGNPLNPLGIAHVLRMVGAFLDSKGYRFSRLRWRRGTLTLWHINGNGKETKEIFSAQNLYDQWVRHFKKRRPLQNLKATGSN
jgi:hypothetical protein